MAVLKVLAGEDEAVLAQRDALLDLCLDALDLGDLGAKAICKCDGQLPAKILTKICIQLPPPWKLGTDRRMLLDNCCRLRGVAEKTRHMHLHLHVVGLCNRSRRETPTHRASLWVLHGARRRPTQG